MKSFKMFPDIIDDNFDWLRNNRQKTIKQIKRITMKNGIQILGTVVFNKDSFTYSTSFKPLKEFLKQYQETSYLGNDKLKPGKITIKTSNYLINDLIKEGYKVNEYEN